MRVIVLGIVISAFCGVAASGQKRSAQNRTTKLKPLCSTGQKLVDRNNPAAFLTFIKKERVETETRRGNDADYLFFTLTNNSSWPIWLDMSGEEEQLGDASLYTEVQDLKSGKILHGSLACHVCSFNPIGPGKKLAFSVPFEYASRSSLMKLAFDFGWEMDAKVDGAGVQHTVSFYFKELPDSVLPK